MNETVFCIACNKPLSDILKALNMNFHPECSSQIIKTALEILENKHD